MERRERVGNRRGGDVRGLWRLLASGADPGCKNAGNRIVVFITEWSATVILFANYTMNVRTELS
jgi:hypothetical protein